MNNPQIAFRQCWRNYTQDIRGNFSILLATSLLVIVLGIAVAVDSSRAYSIHNRMQNSLDTVVTSHASHFLQTGNEDKARSTGSAFSESNSKIELTNLEIFPIQKNADELIVTATASAKLPAMFNGAFNKSAKVSTVHSEAIIKIRDITTVVVPDISWSMRGADLASVKSALNAFSDEMFSLPPEFKSRLQMSSVPFAGSVNVSSLPNVSNLLTDWTYGSPMGRQPDNKKYYTNNLSCQNNDIHTEIPLRGTNLRKQTNSWRNVVVRHEYWRDREGRTHSRPVKEWRCVPSATQTIQWSGCLQTEQNEFNSTRTLSARTKKPLPTTYTRSHPHCPSSTSTIQANLQTPMAYSRHVNKLEIGFGTSHDVGLLWASRVMEPNWSSFFNTSSRPWKNEKFPKFVVLLSDGKSSPIGYEYDEYTNRSENVIDGNSKKLCDYLKGNDVLIYGISYGNSRAVEIIKECASDKLHFQASRNDVTEVFKKIATDIKSRGVRISN